MPNKNYEVHQILLCHCDCAYLAKDGFCGYFNKKCKKMRNKKFPNRFIAIESCIQEKEIVKIDKKIKKD